jgi:hypothetical protein
VKHFNEEPYYFLALVPKCDEDDQIGDDESLLLQTVCPAFDQLNIDAEFFIGVLYEDDIVLKEKLLKVPGALIYQDL